MGDWGVIRVGICVLGSIITIAVDQGINAIGSWGVIGVNIYILGGVIAIAIANRLIAKLLQVGFSLFHNTFISSNSANSLMVVLISLSIH